MKNGSDVLMWRASKAGPTAERRHAAARQFGAQAAPFAKPRPGSVRTVSGRYAASQAAATLTTPRSACVPPPPPLSSMPPSDPYTSNEDTDSALSQHRLHQLQSSKPAGGEPEEIQISFQKARQPGF